MNLTLHRFDTKTHTLTLRERLLGRVGSCFDVVTKEYVVGQLEWDKLSKKQLKLLEKALKEEK